MIASVNLSDWLIMILLAMIIDAVFGGRAFLGRISGLDRLFFVVIDWLSVQLNRDNRSDSTLYVRGAVVLAVMLPVLFMLGLSLGSAVFQHPFVTLFCILLIAMIIGQKRVWQVVREVNKALGEPRGSDSATETEDRYKAARWALERMVLRLTDGLINNVIIILIGGFALLLPYRFLAMFVANGAPAGVAKPTQPYYSLAVLLYDLISLPGTILNAIIMALSLALVPGGKINVFHGATLIDLSSITARRLPLALFANGLAIAFEKGGDLDKTSSTWIGPKGGRARIKRRDIQRALIAAFIATSLVFIILLFLLGFNEAY